MLKFKDKLYNITKELNKYHRPKSELIEFYIKKRLNKSTCSYIDEINKSVHYIQSKNDLTIINNIRK